MDLVKQLIRANGKRLAFLCDLNGLGPTYIEEVAGMTLLVSPAGTAAANGTFEPLTPFFGSMDTRSAVNGWTLPWPRSTTGSE